MAPPESWLIKVKSAISTSLDSVRSTMTNPDVISITGRRKAKVGILAFEIASLMSKLLHLWRSLSDSHIARLRHDVITQQGVRKIVSDDDNFLLSLACAELTESLRLVAESMCTLSKRCADPGLRRFDRSFKEFTESGHDPDRWVMSWKEMESKAEKKMDRYIASTATLYKEMEELSEAEHALGKLLQCSAGYNNQGLNKITAVQQKIFWQKQEVKCLKQASLWGCSFDAVTLLLARSAFTVLTRIKHVFSVGQQHSPPLPRSISISATVYPSSPPPHFASGPLVPSKQLQQHGFFESNSRMFAPPATTLGAAAMALQYANVVVVIEKMIRSPRAIGAEAREDLYAMLPWSVRGLLRERLRGVVGFGPSDAGLAEEWRVALGRIVEWLGPMAHSTIRWQGERSFERRSAAAPRANVMVLQTLYFANREKAEAAIAELLVGLNYLWRFEREMTAKAAAAALMMMDCSNKTILEF